MYFPNEIRGNDSEDKTKKLTEKAVFVFLRDFDICPTLLNKSVAYKLFLTSYDNPLPLYSSTGLDIIEATG